MFQLLELLAAGAPQPALVLGFPVGFVGAAEAKAALAAFGRGLDFITLQGRRGGSALAAAAVNALASTGRDRRGSRVIGIGEDGIAGSRPGSSRADRNRRGASRRRAPSWRWCQMAAAERAAVAAPASRQRSPTIAAQPRPAESTVLASGDPMWYGVGATLARHFPREEMTILPQPGAFSLAAARLGWPLADVPR